MFTSRPAALSTQTEDPSLFQQSGFPLKLKTMFHEQQPSTPKYWKIHLERKRSKQPVKKKIKIKRHIRKEYLNKNKNDRA